MMYAVISASQWNRKMPASCRSMYGDLTYSDAVSNGTFPWAIWSLDESEFLIKEANLPLSKAVIQAEALELMALPAWVREELPENVVEELPEPVDYSAMTVTNLRKLASDSGVVGYSGMKKADLVSALESL
jgi:hypothetical protein